MATLLDPGGGSGGAPGPWVEIASGDQNSKDQTPLIPGNVYLLTIQTAVPVPTWLSGPISTVVGRFVTVQVVNVEGNYIYIQFTK